MTPPQTSSQEWSWSDLLTDALKSGLSVDEFWQMTPRETALAFGAAKWRFERERRHLAWLAWHIAAMMRSRRMPSLRKLIGMPVAQKLTGDEAAGRAREHAEMIERMRN